MTLRGKDSHGLLPDYLGKTDEVIFSLGGETDIERGIEQARNGDATKHPPGHFKALLIAEPGTPEYYEELANWE